jgi:two-component system, NarL family, sensor histidine kinase UhpB
MSLRVRLMISIAMVLLVCLGFDGGFGSRHAVGKVDTEIRARLVVSAHTVENAVAEGLGEGAREPLESLVKDFNEDRHLRASLVDNAGATIVASTPLSPSEPAPRWSYRLLASISMIARVDVPSPSNATLLETDAHDEIGGASSDIVLSDAVLATWCALVVSMVQWPVERALQSFHDLSATFSGIGGGVYPARIVERRPLELAQICRGFNQISRRLGEMEARNGCLAEQLTIVQEEQRSDLARDLHEGIGPLLVAVNVNLPSKAMRSHLVVESGIDAIRDAVGKLRKDVRSIHRRLRPATLLDLGPGVLSTTRVRGRLGLYEDPDH